MPTDTAPHIIMTKAAHRLKPFYSNFVHVTCVASGIHRIAKKLQILFVTLMNDDLIKYNGEPLAFFYVDNFEEFKNIFQ